MDLVAVSELRPILLAVSSLHYLIYAPAFHTTAYLVYLSGKQLQIHFGQEIN